MADRATKFSKAMQYAKTYGLDRDERLSLASTLLWRDVTSWKDLSEDDLVRLLDAMEGFALLTHLLTDHAARRMVTQRTATCVDERSG